MTAVRPEVGAWPRREGVCPGHEAVVRQEGQVATPPSRGLDCLRGAGAVAVCWLAAFWNLRLERPGSSNTSPKPSRCTGSSLPAHPEIAMVCCIVLGLSIFM